MTNLNNPSQSNSQKSNLNSISTKLLLLLSFSFIFVLLLSTFGSAQNQTDDTPYNKANVSFLNMSDYVLYSSSNISDTYYNKYNLSKRITKIYSEPRVPLGGNLDEGVYVPISNITTFNSINGNLELRWNNKSVILKSYIYDNKNKIKKYLESTDIREDLDFNTNIIKESNLFYFNHTFNKLKIKDVDYFGYDIITENVECIINKNSLICDEQAIDFSEAVNKQKLKVVLQVDSNPQGFLNKIIMFFKLNKEDKIEISGNDLSYIDPTVTPASDDWQQLEYYCFDDTYDYHDSPDEVGRVDSGFSPNGDIKQRLMMTWDYPTGGDTIPASANIDNVYLYWYDNYGSSIGSSTVDIYEFPHFSYPSEYPAGDAGEAETLWTIVDWYDYYTSISIDDDDVWYSSDLGATAAANYEYQYAQYLGGGGSLWEFGLSFRKSSAEGCNYGSDRFWRVFGTQPYITVTWSYPIPASSMVLTGGTSGVWGQGDVTSTTTCGSACTNIGDCVGGGCTATGNYASPYANITSTEGTTTYRSAGWSATYPGGYGTYNSATIMIDKTNPTVTATATSPPGGAAYTYGTTTGSSVQNTLTCVDTISGCASTTYCTDLNNTCIPGSAYGAPFTVATYGTSYIRYFSTDNSGRVSATGSSQILISPHIITLNNPANGAGLIGNSTTLNCSAVALAGNINTLILYIDGIANTSVSPGAATGSIQTTLNFSKTIHTWNCGANNSVGFSSMGTARSFLMGSNLSTYSSSNNASTYETKLESFKFNISYDKTIYSGGVASFIYGGIDIADGVITVTDDTQPIERFINVDAATTVPDGRGNNSFYMSFMLSKYAGGYDILNSSNGSISVNASIFGLCNSTNNVVYLNVTFKDQTAWTPLNMTLSVTDDYFWNNPSIYDGTQTVHHFFSNTSENALYQFCFDPAAQPIILSGITMEYSASGYPSVPWSSTGLNLSNQSTQLVFYPCSTSVCAVSTLVITDTAGNYVDQAFLIISTILETVDPVVISTGYTDSSGAFTAFLNPLKSHSVTINKTGCVFTTRSFIPTSATATNIEIDCGTGGVPLIAPYSGIISGLEFRKTPMSGTLEDGMNLFELRVMSTRSNIQKIRMEVITNNATLLYAAEKVVGTPSCLNYDCYVNFSYNTSLTNYSSIKGRYFVDLGRGWLSLENDAWWSLHITPIANISSNMKNFWTDMKDMFDSSADYIGNKDEINRAEFTRIMWVFIIMCLLFAAFNKFSGYDSANPGAFLVLMTFVFVMGSAAGGITGQGYFYLDGLFGNIVFLNNYIISIYMILITLTYFLNVQRRNS